jgi:Ca-activated chloride channel homolog
MDFIYCAYPWLLWTLIFVIFLVSLYRFYYYKPIVYRYSLAALCDAMGFSCRGVHKNYQFLLRLILLVLLALLAAKPRIVDYQSKLYGEGVDMVLALDVSNSMQFIDDERDPRTRLDIAKQEAIRFIENREQDPIGLVIFGRDVVSRCPVTLDKKILKEIIKDTTIGTVDGRGTLLYTGMLSAANRLKDCKGASKIMIVLTDGAAYEDDKTREQVVAIAKKLGIKIYTIGIGHDGIIYVQTPFGPQPIQGVNKEDLTYVAENTGGRYFEAKKPQDMKAIYTTIDKLEKSEYETTIFTHFHDIFMPFLCGAALVAVLELLSSTFIWFTV